MSNDEGCSNDLMNRSCWYVCHSGFVINSSFVIWISSFLTPFALFKAARRQKVCDMSTIAATEFLPLVATADAAADSVVVSLHDVAPCTQQITSTIISELSAHGVRVCSVLVVPDYHHEGPFARHREFVTWLRALEADGHEVVIHGYFHERSPRTRETLRDKFMTRFYTQNEGEFYDLG